jgi:hypothetical protein
MIILFLIICYLLEELFVILKKQLLLAYCSHLPTIFCYLIYFMYAIKELKPMFLFSISSCTYFLLFSTLHSQSSITTILEYVVFIALFIKIKAS